IFKPNSHVGVNVSVEDLRKEFDALMLTGGACARRDLPIPGRELKGVHQAMDYLPMQNRLCEGDAKPENFISAEGKNVVIIGGGDTGADCIGTAHRQGAKSVTSLEIMPRPPEKRSPNNPWPEWPFIFRTASAHEAGGARIDCVSTTPVAGDAHGNVQERHSVRWQT